MSAPPEKKMKVDSDSGDDNICSPKVKEVNSDSDDVDVDDVDAPQEEEECPTISIEVEFGNCSSPVSRIKGYPWRLILFKKCDGYSELFVRCEKSMDSELWSCEADFTIDDGIASYNRHFVFDSTNKGSKEYRLKSGLYRNGTQLDVEIKPHDNGNKWRARPIVGTFAPRDGCLVIGGDTKLFVNKESLASQSPYFDRLFNGDFKEKNMAEIPIEDVSAEEFTNLMRIVYGENGDSVVDAVLTRENVHSILDLADIFHLKIVEDGVVNTLLSSSSTFSIHERLLIADKHGLTMCKERIISQYYRRELIEVTETPEYRQFSINTKDSITKRMVECLKDC